MNNRISRVTSMRNRFKYFILLIILLYGFSVNAGEYALHVYQTLPEGQKSTIPSQMMKARMQGMVGRYGFRQAAHGERFILTSFVKVLERDSQPGQPAVIRLKLEVLFCIGDGIEGKKISEAKMVVEGSGNVEVKAYIEAYKNIANGDSLLKKMFDTGKEGIKAYYTRQCGAIVKQAQDLAAKSQYEQGLMKLLQVPDDCTACSEKAMDAATPIYKKYVDANGMQMLTGAKKAWTSKQNAANAEKALKALAEISPDASCYKDAQQYFREINEFFTAAGKKAPEYKMMEPGTDKDPERTRQQVYKRLVERMYKMENHSFRYATRGWN